MKYKKILDTSGMIVTLIAFACMATGIALTLQVLFFVSVGILLVGIVLSSVLPAYITGKWQKMMVEHGVPTKAKLINITDRGGRFGDVKLDFQTENDVLTSAFIPKFEKQNFVLDRLYDIRYNPDDIDICLVILDKKQSNQPEGAAQVEAEKPAQQSEEVTDKTE